jgi:hypothetical protein
MRSAVKKNIFAKKAGIGVALLAIVGVVAVRMAQSALPGLSFLKQGEVVYSGRTTAKLAGLKATETFMNVPLNWEDAVKKIKQEIPTAIERRDGDGPYFVVPQLHDGRVQLAAFPEQSITVRPGRLVRAGARMMVRADSGEGWSHVQIQDFHQPSVLESTFNWIGDRLGI